MKKIVLNIVVVSLQLLIVGLFFMTVFSEKVNITKKVSIVDNENLDKIADSVSLLFISEETPLVDNEIASVYVDMSSLDEKVEEEKVEELYGEILLSAKAPKKDGKGYAYPVMGHLVGLEGSIRGDGRKLLAMAGY